MSVRNPYLAPRTDPYEIARMEEALMRIGYSRHHYQPRFGPKAQIARWGLGEDELPPEELPPSRDPLAAGWARRAAGTAGGQGEAYESDRS